MWEKQNIKKTNPQKWDKNGTDLRAMKTSQNEKTWENIRYFQNQYYLLNTCYC